MAAASRGAGLSGIEYLKAIAAGEIPPPPIAVLLGFELVEVEEGRAVFAVTPGEYHYNPIGVVHGGLAATLLDSVDGLRGPQHAPAGVATRRSSSRSTSRARSPVTPAASSASPRSSIAAARRDRRGPGRRRGTGKLARARHDDLPAVQRQRRVVDLAGSSAASHWRSPDRLCLRAASASISGGHVTGCRVQAEAGGARQNPSNFRAGPPSRSRASARSAGGRRPGSAPSRAPTRATGASAAGSPGRRRRRRAGRRPSRRRAGRRCRHGLRSARRTPSGGRPAAASSRSASAPETILNPSAATVALSVHSVPLRRWQRWQWQ